MEAYIEYVILDNFSIDLLILIITFKLLKLKIVKYRVLIAVAVGTIGAVITPLIDFGIAIAIRFTIAPIMCAVANKHDSFKRFVLFLIVMLVVTFSIGGAIMAIFNMSVSDSYLIVNYPQGGVVGLSALSLLLVYYGLSQLLFSAKHSVSYNEIFDVKLITENTVLNCKGFIDTGNTLYDDNYNPLIVCCNTLSNDIKRIATGDGSVLVNTVNGSNMTRYYIIEKVMIYINGQVNTIYKVGCIISETKLEQYNLLLHSEMLKEG